jgi:hypothetical protein
MSFYDEEWFHHAVTDTVYQLAQQRATITAAAVRQEQATGKTHPFHRIGSIDMAPITSRHMVGVGMDITLDKRRVALKDFYARVYVDDLDQLRMLPNLQSAKSQQLANALNRQKDVLIIAGALGSAVTVDEGAETTGAATLATTGGFGNYGQVIPNGAVGLTVGKIMDCKTIFDSNNIPLEDRYFFYSPIGMRRLLEDSKVTSADYNTIRALTAGGFGMDETWHSFKWRQSTLLPYAGAITLPNSTVYQCFTSPGATIRSCVAWWKPAVGYASLQAGKTTVKDRPDLVNTTQVETTLSGNAMRIEEVGVVRVDIDESK